MLTIVKKALERFGLLTTHVETTKPEETHVESIEPEDNLERCFDCNGTNFYEGPSAGASMNIKCGDCGSYFNSTGRMFPLERIRWIDHTIVAKNFIPFDPSMITDWKTVIIHDFSEPYPNHIYHMNKTERDMNEMLPALTFWCSVELRGRWSIKASFLYFELEEDVISFKLKW